MKEEDIRSLRDWARVCVGGFADVDEGAIDDGVDYMVGTADVPRGLVEQLLCEALDEQRSAEARFPVTTDNDRLDAAFAALNNKGIFAEQNYWCCQTCGHSAAQDEVAQSNGKYRGYVFYHQQDTESAITGGGLYLAFGSADGDVDVEVEVARAAVDELAARGLKTAWNGTVQQRPYVQLTWQRRRLSSPPS